MPGEAAPYLLDMLPMLRDAMVRVHLLGALRAQRLARRAGIELARDTTPAFRKSIEAMAVRMNLRPDELAALEVQYEAAGLRVLSEVNTSVERALQARMVLIQAEGLHVAKGIIHLRGVVQAWGAGSSVTGAAIETAFRTQAQLAYSAGRWSVDQSAAVQEILWGYKYVTVGDARVRPAHRALEGFKARKDDPIWKTHWPPNGYNCRCQTIPIFEETTERLPPPLATIDGQQVVPGPDKGFFYNSGLVFGAAA